MFTFRQGFSIFEKFFLVSPIKFLSDVKFTLLRFFFRIRIFFTTQLLIISSALSADTRLFSTIIISDTSAVVKSIFIPSIVLTLKIFGLFE